MSKVEITHVGYQTLRMLTRYMTEFIGFDRSLDLAQRLLSICENKLSANPDSCPICHELELLGISDYKQLTVDKYKILYRYDETQNCVFITAFMRQKQSAQQLLIDHSLLLH
ncbi:MAG: plasmid stabilization system protein ParE [Phenylobacterium sp.]|jgi:plasmid stabilization system protein ParE